MRRRTRADLARTARINATVAEAAQLRQVIGDALDTLDAAQDPTPEIPTEPDPSTAAAGAIEDYLADHRRLFPHPAPHRTQSTGP